MKNGQGGLPRFDRVTHAIASSGEGKVHAAGGGQYDSGPLIDIEYLYVFCENAPVDPPLETTRTINCRKCLQFFDGRGASLNGEALEFTDVYTCDCDEWRRVANPGREPDWSPKHYSPHMATEVFPVGEQTHGVAFDGSGRVHVVVPLIQQVNQDTDAEMLEPVCDINDGKVYRRTTRPVNCGACIALLDHPHSLYEGCDCTHYGIVWGNYR